MFLETFDRNMSSLDLKIVAIIILIVLLIIVTVVLSGIIIKTKQKYLTNFLLAMYIYLIKYLQNEVSTRKH